MCKYQKSLQDLPYPRVQFESECGFKLVLAEGYNQDWKSKDYGKIKIPQGKCLKCQSLIEVIETN